MYGSTQPRRARITRILAVTVAVATATISGGALLSPDGSASAAAFLAEVAGPGVAARQAVRMSPPTTTTSPTVGGLSTFMFPMQSTPFCEVLNNYGDPRSGGRTHEGTDIMGYYRWTADQTPDQAVYAVVDGTLGGQKIAGAAGSELSGNSWRVYAATGKTYYMYAHLSRFADGLQNGSVVTRGQIIGYVGDTGDAGPGNFHLHFEVHPTGLTHGVVNPVPLFASIPTECRVDRKS